MKAQSKRWIQIILAVLLVAAAVRLLVTYMGRRDGDAAPRREEQRRAADRGLDPDAYVTPKKLYLYDLNSAKNYLTGKPVWVREGYYYTYFPYDPARRRVNFKQEAGLLMSLERLDIKDAIQTPPPGPGAQAQVMLVFEKQGELYGVPIGAAQGKNYSIVADQMLFYQDPRDLYKHWPKEVWEAIERREVKTGMNELQTSFAIGLGVPQRSNDPSVKTVVYPRGGNKTTVTFVNGKVTDIHEEGAGKS
jgi:hypothetical protein